MWEWADIYWAALNTLTLCKTKPSTADKRSNSVLSHNSARQSSKLWLCETRYHQASGWPAELQPVDDVSANKNRLGTLTGIPSSPQMGSWNYLLAQNACDHLALASHLPHSHYVCPPSTDLLYLTLPLLECKSCFESPTHLTGGLKLSTFKMTLFLNPESLAERFTTHMDNPELRCNPSKQEVRETEAQELWPTAVKGKGPWATGYRLQNTQVTSRSWEWPQADRQQGNATSSYSHMNWLNSANSLEWAWKKIDSQEPLVRNTALSNLWFQSCETWGRELAEPCCEQNSHLENFAVLRHLL